MSNHIEPFLVGSTYNDVTEESVTSTYTVTPSQTEDTCIERLTKQERMEDITNWSLHSVFRIHSERKTNKLPSHQFLAEVFELCLRNAFGEDIPELFQCRTLHDGDLAEN